MPGASIKSRLRAATAATASPSQTALYTYDMLVSLKRLADANKQTELAALIGAAAAEAHAIVRAEKRAKKS